MSAATRCEAYPCCRHSDPRRPAIVVVEPAADAGLVAWREMRSWAVAAACRASPLEFVPRSASGPEIARASAVCRGCDVRLGPERCTQGAGDRHRHGHHLARPLRSVHPPSSRLLRPVPCGPRGCLSG
jgi:hypothetical protein